MPWSELWGLAVKDCQPPQYDYTLRMGLLAVNARINGEASAREDEEAGADGMQRRCSGHKDRRLA